MKGVIENMASMIDYDEYECDNCGKVGVIPDGGFDYICSSCGYEGTIGEDNLSEIELDEDSDIFSGD